MGAKSTTAVARVDPVPTSVADVMLIGDTFAKSGFFADSRSAAQAVVKIMAGRELGIGPFASMRGFYVTKNGRIEMAANLFATMVRNSGRYDYEVKHLDNEKCVIDFLRLLPGGKTKVEGTSEFTLADARKAGTQNVDKFPRNMLFARAMSNGVKWYCPEVTNGVTIYAEGEVEQDADGHGDVRRDPFPPPADLPQALPAPAPADTVPFPPVEYVGDDQLQRIEGHVAALKLSADGVNKRLDAMGVRSWTELTKAQADEIEAKLSAAVVAKAEKAKVPA